MPVQSPNIPIVGGNLDNASSPFHPFDLVGERIEHLIDIVPAYPEIPTGLEEAELTQLIGLSSALLLEFNQLQFTLNGVADSTL